jgi:hypothetical protein
MGQMLRVAVRLDYTHLCTEWLNTSEPVTDCLTNWSLKFTTKRHWHGCTAQKQCQNLEEILKRRQTYRQCSFQGTADLGVVEEQ